MCIDLFWPSHSQPLSSCCDIPSIQHSMSFESHNLCNSSCHTSRLVPSCLSVFVVHLIRMAGSQHGPAEDGVMEGKRSFHITLFTCCKRMAVSIFPTIGFGKVILWRRSMCRTPGVLNNYSSWLFQNPHPPEHWVIREKNQLLMSGWRANMYIVQNLLSWGSSTEVNQNSVRLQYLHEQSCVFAVVGSQISTQIRVPKHSFRLQYTAGWSTDLKERVCWMPSREIPAVLQREVLAFWDSGVVHKTVDLWSPIGSRGQSHPWNVLPTGTERREQ